MKRMIAVCCLALLCGGWGFFTPMDTARMPQTSDGGYVMSQGDAISLAAWALKDPATTAGKPELAARAIAAEDWLAGQTILYGNYGDYQPGGEPSWQELRQQARSAIGVPMSAPSQDVVDRLFATADALKAGNAAAARTQLAAPIFTLGPDRTLAALSNLPPLSGWSWAFADLERHTNRSFGRARYIR